MRFEEAEEMAIHDGADEDLVRTIAERIGRIRIVGLDGDRIVATSAELLGADVIVDGLHHEVRAGGRIIALERRPVLRRLLYAMAARVNQPVNKEELVRAAWDAEYDPRRHDTTLRVNIRRLRVILGDEELAVERDEVGYRLRAPDGFAYIDVA